MRTAIVGGGKGCRSLLEFVLERGLVELRLDVRLVCDPRSHAPGILYAAAYRPVRDSERSPRDGRLDVWTAALGVGERLAVLPEHRGNGYGTRLAGHAINVARAMGATTVGIGIIAADTGLKAFYRALGFNEGETKIFPHLPFAVALMNILV